MGPVMRAVRIPAFGGTPVSAELPLPEPGPGETLIKVAAAALGHLDHTVASGRFPQAPEPPYIPCGDGAGYVVSSATHAEGTLVWVRGGGVGMTRDGLAAEYAVVPDAAAHPAPDGTPSEQAACFFSCATAAHYAVGELGEVGAGQRIAVVGGAGAVGALACQLATAAGADVTAVVARPEDSALVPDGTRAVTGDDLGHDYDLLIDTVGGADLNDRLDAVRPGGRAVLVGYAGGEHVTLHLPGRLSHDVELRFLNMQRRADAAVGIAGELLDRIAKGELELRVRRYPLTEAARAWRELTGGAGGRVVLVPDGEGR